MTILRPIDGTVYLAVDAVVEIANAEFGFVQCDLDRGIRYAAARLLKDSAGLSHDEKEVAMAMRMNSLELILGDDRRAEKHFLKCFVIPASPIELLYCYNSHESQTRHLRERLAAALNYQVVTT